MLGSFISPDTMIPGAGNPQAWDRYVGLGNNPVKYVDPSGHIHIADGPVNDRFNVTKYKKYLSEHPIQQRPTVVQEKSPINPSLPVISQPPSPSLSCDPCLADSEVPSWWDTDPSHPDYYTFSVYPGIPTEPIGGAISLTMDRYGGIYFGLGGNITKSISTTSYGLVGGYVGSPLDDIIPDQANVSHFLEGLTFNGSLGIVGGGGITWSPSAGQYIEHVSSEFGGVGPASIGISATYNWKIYDLRYLFGK